ncbi:unnamed protein product, partial [Rhizoctonia solani]
SYQTPLSLETNPVCESATIQFFYKNDMSNRKLNAPNGNPNPSKIPRLVLKNVASAGHNGNHSTPNSNKSSASKVTAESRSNHPAGSGPIQKRGMRIAETKTRRPPVGDRGQRIHNAKTRQGLKVGPGTIDLVQNLQAASVHELAELTMAADCTDNYDEALARAEIMKEMADTAQHEIKDGILKDPDAGISFDDLCDQTISSAQARKLEERLNRALESEED